MSFWSQRRGFVALSVFAAVLAVTFSSTPRAAEKSEASSKKKSAAKKAASEKNAAAKGANNAPSNQDAASKPEEAPGGSDQAAKISANDSSAVTDEQVIKMINEFIRKGWQDAEISPSSEATENEWCRRLYLDVLGRVPSVDELQKYLGSKSRSKKQELVDALLDSDEYIEEYARNWSTIWTNILIGRPRDNNDDRRDMVNREGMQQYLRRTFLENRPYDRMVYDLVAATGSNTPGQENYNGATNFLLDNLQENGTTATAKVARYFLGLQVQCTQCHNHPFNKWQQSQFWGMNAFFRQTKALRSFQGRDVANVRLENEDFAGESGQDPKDAEIYYELRNGEMRVAYPTFVDGTTISKSGYIDETNRRKELAKLITKSEFLGKAISNRVWAHFLGYGFTKPIDDLPSDVEDDHNQPSHPELLDYLGKTFAATGHDYKRLIRWIVLSEAYSLSSKHSKNNSKDDPTLGEKPRFSHFYLRQMQAEELYESLLVATEAHKTQGNFEEESRKKTEWLSQFTLAFGTDEGDDTTTFNGTIPQMLMMMNGDLIQRATSAEKGSFLHRIGSSAMKPAQRLNHLYLAALSRKPTQVEITLANELLTARDGNTMEALQDVWWALLNSNEFIQNH